MLGRFNIANTVLVGMAQAVSVHAERCNRMCHKSSKCNLCETNCPTQAIKVGAVGTKIDIDWDKCSYCAICVSICPTGVFGVRDLGYTGFLNTYLKRISDEGILSFTCKELAKNSAEEKEPIDPKKLIADLIKEKTGKNGTEYAVLECLGVLALPDLLYFYTHGAKQIKIKFPDCNKCANRFGRMIIDDELDELIKLYEYFEYLKGTEIKNEDGEIIITFPHEFERTAPTEKEKESKRAEIVTRRGMFDLLRANVTTTAMRSAVLLTPQEIPNKTPFRTAKELPIKRRIFLDSLSYCGKLLKTEIQPGPYFFAQEINQEKCTFCKICTRFCPSGALHMSEEGDKILFTAAECTSCGMCLIACYHKNIRRMPKLNLKDFFSEVPKSQKKENT